MNHRAVYSQKNPAVSRKQHGFSLFEMVAFIIVAAIIYSVAVNRFAEFPEAAERANFLAVMTQIQTGINLEMMLGVSTGFVNSIQSYENLNPMDMLLKTPSNYLGAFETIVEDELPRRSWYFDKNTSELVYLINESQNAYLVINSVPVPTSEFRFKIVVTYRDPVTLANLTFEELQAVSERTPASTREQDGTRASKARLSGAVLRPVIPFMWEGTGIYEDELAHSG